MNSEKRKDDLMKQGRGLAALSVWLIIFALVLGIVLLDLSFVPSGELWDELKAWTENSYIMEYLDEQGKEHGDKEVWEAIKTAMVEDETVPFKSGFLCWAVIQMIRNRRLKEEKEWTAQIEQAELNAQTAMEILDEYLSDMGIYTNYIKGIHCYLHDKRISIMYEHMDVFDDDDFPTDEDENELASRLLEAFPDVNEAGLAMYVLGSECTAAVFAPDVNTVSQGVDFPHIDEYGHFDTERRWGGYGWSHISSNKFIIGYIDKTGYVG